MPNYKNSKIYKIVDKTNNNIYIGSTTLKISNRLAEHRRLYKFYLNNNENKKYKCTSFEIIKNNNYEIILIEELELNNNIELKYKERYYIENNNCVNKKKKVIRSKEDIKQYEKNWIENNKEKFKQHQKKY